MKINAILVFKHIITLLGSILIVVCYGITNFACAFGVSLSGKVEFAGIPSGIIRDIEVVGDATYIASENGVFRLLGGHSEVVTYVDDPKLNGTVSDLFYGAKNTLWITEYGAGVFSINLETGQYKQRYQEHNWPQYAWKVVEIENYLVVSIIQGVLVVDKVTGEIQDWAKDIGLHNVDNVFSIASDSSDLAFISSQEGLLKVNVSELSVEIIPTNMYFPRLSSVDAVSVFDEFLYIGAREGVYRQNLVTEEVTFYPFENGTRSAYAVSDIYRTKNGRIFIGAGGLYELKDNVVSVPAFMQPLLSSEGIRSIVKIDELPSGELLLASSQLGLISLTATHEAINLIHEGEAVLRHNIQRYGVTRSGDFVVQTRQNKYILDLDKGALSKEKGNGLELNTCADYRTSQVGAIYSTTHNYTGYCDLEYLEQFDAGINAFYAYHDNGERAVFDLVSDGGIVDQFPAPSQLVHSFLTQSGEIIGFDSKDAIHVQMSKFNWRIISPDEGNWNGINCLLETNERFLVCTSGQGIKSINKTSGQIEDSGILGNEDVRFVRGGLHSSEGNLWFVTNKGLYLVTKKNTFLLSTSEGIFDTDFEYGGIIEVNGKLVILGDKYAYLINEKLALEALTRDKVRKSRVIFLKTSWRDTHGKEHVIFPYSSQKSAVLSLDNNFIELNIDFRTNSFSHFDKQNLEFRILGINDTWKVHKHSHALLSISDIDFGEYEIQARVVGDNNPISALRFEVKKPFFLLYPAVIAYLLFALLVFFAYRNGIIHNWWEKFKSTRLYVNLTRYEITDGHSKFEKMLRSKELFINEITHDLRTPIQIIKGTLQQLSESPEENGKAFLRVQENMRRVEQLINQMSNGVPQAKDAADYYQTYTTENIRHIVNALDSLAKQKRQTLEVKIKGIKAVSLINDSLEKILSNLIQNAVKYTPALGTIKVAVSLDSSILKIVVSDDGDGIDEQLLAKVFDRFTKGNVSKEGEGIGLSIVKHLVQLNQGTISVESKKGVGSKFSIVLPVDDVEFINSHVKEIVSNVDGKKPKTLLLVDDNREFRTYLYDLLSKSYQCLVAKNGQQALEVMSSFKVDLVVTDQIMPVMDGISLTKKIRAHAKYTNTPILMLSAKIEPELEMSALEEKVDYFLAKPAANEEVLLRIEHLLAVRETSGNEAVSNGKPVFEFECLVIPEFSNEKDVSFFLSFISVLEKNFHKEGFNRNQAAQQLLMSTRSLNRRMSGLFEYNFSEFLSRYRIEKSIPMLLEGRTILETCLEVGYGAAAYFSTSFKKIMGVPPKKFVERHKTGACELGERY